MLVKLLRNLFFENKTLLFFMMVTSVLTAIIGCFAYCVYQNYYLTILQGESEASEITISAKGWSGEMTEYTEFLTFNLNNEDDLKQFHYNNYSTLTKGDVIKLVENIPEDIYDDIELITCSATLDNDIFGIAWFDFSFIITNDGIEDVLDNKAISNYAFTNEQMNKSQKNIVISEDLTDSSKDEMVGISTLSYECFRLDTFSGVGDVINITGEEYIVSDVIPKNTFDGTFWRIPFTSLNDDTPFNSSMIIKFKQAVTYNEYKIIQNIVSDNFPDDAYVEDMNLSFLADFKYYRTIIMITFAVALLFAINLAVLYKYVIEKNKNRIVVFRLCGSTRKKCIRLFLMQGMLVCVPVFAFSLFAFHKLLYPIMVEIFPNAIDCLDIYKYLLILIGYAIVSGLVLFVTLCRNIGRKLNFVGEV
ncbi:MAG: hypothetical protein LUE12_03400 [Ruminococcus sp.]|nr:hypothetical protein [Ruminococcus sp.]